METKNTQTGSVDIDQLQKYAQDLAEVYKSEKEKRKELQISEQQLVKYADDLNKTVLESKELERE